MKYSEFHRQIVRKGWQFDHAEGSHYFYKKEGFLSEPIPYHGAKEFQNL
ncbi:MAG TPA: toxin-antitoxin system, toxin component, HicA family protein [Porphyromonadaceae bacterium]|nr:toxin-antitoxin system, toxin component, HicA family protein [Porphyromonadaceae bacterium]